MCVVDALNDGSFCTKSSDIILVHSLWWWFVPKIGQNSHTKTSKSEKYHRYLERCSFTYGTFHRKFYELSLLHGFGREVIALP